MQQLLGQFAAGKLKRGWFCYNDQISTGIDSILVRSECFSYGSSYSVALDSFSYPLAGYNPHLTPSAPNRTRVHGQVSVGLPASGSVNTLEFVLLSEPSVPRETEGFHRWPRGQPLTDNRARPFRLRSLSILRPPLVFMRALKPCVRFLFLFDG